MEPHRRLPGRPPCVEALRRIDLLHSDDASAEHPQRGDASAPFSIRAAHLLGLENAKGNCTGTLSIHDDSLQQNGTAGVQVEIGAIRGIVLGEEDKQVGLRATQNLARNIAKKIEQSPLAVSEQPSAIFPSITEL